MNPQPKFEFLPVVLPTRPKAVKPRASTVLVFVPKPVRHRTPLSASVYLPPPGWIARSLIYQVPR